MGNWIWIFVELSLLACILNVFKNKLCWIVWIIAGLGFGVNAAINGDTPMIILWLTYILLDAYGYSEWSRREDEEEKDDTDL